jgi:predicted aconitase with swiveling domain
MAVNVSISPAPSFLLGGVAPATCVSVSWNVHLAGTALSAVIFSAQYFSSFHGSTSTQVVLMQLATVVNHGVLPA